MERWKKENEKKAERITAGGKEQSFHRVVHFVEKVILSLHTGVDKRVDRTIVDKKKSL